MTDTTKQAAPSGDPVAWMYDLDIGNGRLSVNWVTAKNGDWDSILAVNIRPLYSADSVRAMQLQDAQILEALQMTFKAWINEIDPEEYPYTEDKLRAAIQLLNERLK